LIPSGILAGRVVRNYGRRGHSSAKPLGEIDGLVARGIAVGKTLSSATGRM
jgi:hypothetical protein